jgi:hypothetical protein
MLKHKSLGAVAVGTLAAAALFAANQAGAISSHNDYASAQSHACWRYSNHIEHWVNVCRTYHSVYPRSVPAYPYNGYYSYGYRSPYGSNGPYYGFEPCNGYESSLGSTF